MQTAYKALPTSKKRIEEYVQQLRSHCQLDNVFPFPIMHLLEHLLPQMFPDMTLMLETVEDMPLVEGETMPGTNTIHIREDVYYAACAGDGRARFTVAHEIGHFLMHTPDSIVLCRLEPGTVLKPFENPEWQADYFAGYLLALTEDAMGLSKKQLIQKFQLSEKAAKVTLSRCKA